MYTKILVPLDNSPSDEAIVEHIQPFAKMTGASILLVHVADGFVARLQDQLNLADSEEIKNDEQYLERRKTEIEKSGLKVQTMLVQGEPAPEILKIAAQEHCDLIAMATHGHRGMQDLILGSVADHIRHRTHIPVLMIRSK
jgi:nucleotide-binding universal stress UspA family protein